ncbi:MAG: hypothetical protein Q7S53_03895 [bacterium]|nr:hypothetical protein [bacterium]
MPKPIKLAKHSRGTVDVRLPDAFYKKIWHDVAMIQGEERTFRGQRKKRLFAGPNGEFVEVI